MIDICSFNLMCVQTRVGNWCITSTSPDLKGLLIVANTLHEALSKVSNAVSALREVAQQRDEDGGHVDSL